MTLREAIEDPNLFAPWFGNPSWETWKAFIGAIFGEPLTPLQMEAFRRCAGRTYEPGTPSTEAWVICGRRAGKTFTLALIATYLAAFRDYRPFLAPGERATVLLIATDRKQARVAFRYIKGLLTGVPMLARLIERETAESFDLSNRVTIEVGTASFRSVRGLTLAGCILDEAAFFPTDDSAEPDFEIINAVRPGLATIPGALLLAGSTPYGRRGALWTAFRDHFGKPGPVLVWKAPTRTMNPTIPQSFIDREMERDPASAAAEFLAEFRSDVAAFVAREVIEAAISRGVFERTSVSGVRYQAFVDPSGGASDSMTLAIGHRSAEGAIVLDVLREVRAPFNPEAAADELAEALRPYRIAEVTGDRYGGEWPAEAFRRRGIRYVPSDRPKSDLYRDALPRLNSGEVDLLDNSRLSAQFCGLERRTSRGGRDSIDHSPGGHDDLANAVAGLIATLARPAPRLQLGTFGYGGPIIWRDQDEPQPRSWSRTGGGIRATDGQRVELGVPNGRTIP